MLEDNSDAPDPLSIECKLPGLEPVRARRQEGTVFESDELGRLVLCHRGDGQRSVWVGEQRMPDSRFTLLIACEVDEDQAPGAGHAGLVVGARRRQLKDAAACVGMINDKLQQAKLPAKLVMDDLVLTGIFMPPRPMIEPYTLEYQSSLVPGIAFRVFILRGKPKSVRLEIED